MSTRSFVSVLVNDKFRTIYIHFDGYPEGVGEAIQKFDTMHKALDFVKDGDRSSVDGELYNEPYTEHDSFEEFFNTATNSWIEWYYVFKDGSWFCGNTYAESQYCGTLTPFYEVIASEER